MESLSFYTSSKSTKKLRNSAGAKQNGMIWAVFLYEKYYEKLCGEKKKNKADMLLSA